MGILLQRFGDDLPVFALGLRQLGVHARQFFRPLRLFRLQFAQLRAHAADSALQEGRLAAALAPQQPMALAFGHEIARRHEISKLMRTAALAECQGLAAVALAGEQRDGILVKLALLLRLRKALLDSLRNDGQPFENVESAVIPVLRGFLRRRTGVRLRAAPECGQCAEGMLHAPGQLGEIFLNAQLVRGLQMLQRGRIILRQHEQAGEVAAHDHFFREQPAIGGQRQGGVISGSRLGEVMQRIPGGAHLAIQLAAAVGHRGQRRRAGLASAAQAPLRGVVMQAAERIEHGHFLARFDHGSFFDLRPQDLRPAFDDLQQRIGAAGRLLGQQRNVAQVDQVDDFAGGNLVTLADLKRGFEIREGLVEIMLAVPQAAQVVERDRLAGPVFALPRRCHFLFISRQRLGQFLARFVAGTDEGEDQRFFLLAGQAFGARLAELIRIHPKHRQPQQLDFEFALFGLGETAVAAQPQQRQGAVALLNRLFGLFILQMIVRDVAQHQRLVVIAVFALARCQYRAVILVGRFKISQALVEQRQPVEVAQFTVGIAQAAAQPHRFLQQGNGLLRPAAHPGALPRALVNHRLLSGGNEAAVVLQFDQIVAQRVLEAEFAEIVVVVGEIERQIGFGERRHLLIIDGDAGGQHVDGFFIPAFRRPRLLQREGAHGIVQQPRRGQRDLLEKALLAPAFLLFEIFDGLVVETQREIGRHQAVIDRQTALDQGAGAAQQADIGFALVGISQAQAVQENIVVRRCRVAAFVFRHRRVDVLQPVHGFEIAAMGLEIGGIILARLAKERERQLGIAAAQQHAAARNQRRHQFGARLVESTLISAPAITREQRGKNLRGAGQFTIRQMQPQQRQRHAVGEILQIKPALRCQPVEQIVILVGGELKLALARELLRKLKARRETDFRTGGVLLAQQLIGGKRVAAGIRHRELQQPVTTRRLPFPLLGKQRDDFEIGLFRGGHAAAARQGLARKQQGLITVLAKPGIIARNGEQMADAGLALVLPE